MQVKVKFPILKPHGGTHAIGDVIDMDLESYDSHVAAGNVEALAVAEAAEKAEAEVARIRKEAEETVRKAELEAREKANAAVSAAREKVATERKRTAA